MSERDRGRPRLLLDDVDLDAGGTAGRDAGRRRDSGTGRQLRELLFQACDELGRGVSVDPDREVRTRVGSFPERADILGLNRLDAGDGAEARMAIGRPRKEILLKALLAKLFLIVRAKILL